MDSINSPSISFRLNSSISSSNLSASILEKSSISLIIDNNDSALFFAMFARWRCSSVNLLCNSSPSIPNTPFIGVRISWLIFARNSDFRCVASSALFNASTKSLACVFNEVVFTVTCSSSAETNCFCLNISVCCKRVLK